MGGFPCTHAVCADSRADVYAGEVTWTERGSKEFGASWLQAVT